MSMGGFDPEILQDFLTECGELLDELENRLVELESKPEDLDLLNEIFRALHTIKGSASFLALTNLVNAAHAAESALNVARAGNVVVDKRIMDWLLAAVDVIKQQFVELGAGDPLTAADDQLLANLTLVGDGKYTPDTPEASASTTEAAPTNEPTAEAPSSDLAPGAIKLELPDNKLDLLDFLVADLDESITKLRACAEGLAAVETRATAATQLKELAESLVTSADFFEVDTLVALASGLRDAGQALLNGALPGADALIARVPAAIEMAATLSAGLRDSVVLPVPAGELLPQIAALCDGQPADPSWPAFGAAEADPAEAPAPEAPEPPPAPKPVARIGPETVSEPAAEAGTKTVTAVEQTIRVEVKRLESLMNLVGELVLQKNRIGAIAREAGLNQSFTQEWRELITGSAGDLDRVTGDLQVAVMRTRMQPLDKLFGKYPRLIRDLATKTGKKMRLVIEGGETEVDKSVIEELGDPLVHLMRNSADHGVEKPEDRLAKGKPEEGIIRLTASHEGSHVQIVIADDGKGLPRDIIGRKAVERGLATEGEIANLSDQEIYRFIMLPGFSTAEQVSDLSGRGVGMDVVRTNIEALKGTLDLDSTPGQGTTFTITIPLTVAIMPAMMVGVGEERYAIPLGNILEIVRPGQAEMSTVGEHPVMRLRDRVLPLMSAAELFDLPGRENLAQPFAVVLSLNGKSIGLMVSSLIGQQEVVIKPLEGVVEKAGPVSGATVRDDGGVSLIVDVAELMRIAEGRRTVAAA
ncbi:MAG: chemotaxis protein CheA [Phycisphaerales bacterium]|nr:MAG: chemotaxis protein CheA [Phycisphaerales bacterium]